ncbi:hypothetical protein N0V91_010038 [Didymella pomorum]|uniref:Uncharacterized protein n=1 Tax=Didymella pomorum TaxID=749634 RepID=A0A9W9D3Y2_9PLEO|nr:hypothetical protein N0V91_010038 [Didymella pomorum]
MDIEGDDETSVTVHQLYKQVGETLDLPVHVPSIDSGERAGRMFRGFEFWPPEKQLMLLRQEFRRPYGANEIRKWMYSNGITPQEVTSLIRVQGVYVGDDKDRCPLIDFDHWPDFYLVTSKPDIANQTPPTGLTDRKSTIVRTSWN